MNGGEKGGAGADDDGGGGGFEEAKPEAAAGGGGLLGVEQGDAVAEGLLENLDDLASEGDFGDEQQHVLPAGERPGNQMDVDFGDERIKTYAENEHWNLELAYAITVYKGQGSEYEIVIIPVLSCYWRALRRNLYYTAVTRAKRKVILVGSKQALAQAIRTGKGKGRNTILGARLRKVYRYLESEEKIA